MTNEPDVGAKHFLSAFSNPESVANYADGPARFVPGFDALHRMTAILLAETAPHDARVLVLGAGGGLELKALALTQPGWTFVGVDPAEAMLDLARQTLGPLNDRVQLVKGYIDDAPQGPFDAATCLLTLHFLDEQERLSTLQSIHRRLKAGAPFVAAHASFPQAASGRSRWLDRYAAYAIASGADRQQATGARNAVDASLNMFSPDRDETLLREAGFADPEMFFAAFTWRGWIGHA